LPADSIITGIKTATVNLKDIYMQHNGFSYFQFTVKINQFLITSEKHLP